MKLILKANLVLAILFTLLLSNCTKDNADSVSPSSKRGTILSNPDFGNAIKLTLPQGIITSTPNNLIWRSEYLNHSYIDANNNVIEDNGYIFYSIDTVNGRLGDLYMYKPYYDRMLEIYPTFNQNMSNSANTLIEAIQEHKDWKDEVDIQNPIKPATVVPMCSQLTRWQRFWGTKCATGEMVEVPEAPGICRIQYSSGWWFFRHNSLGLPGLCDASN